MTRESPERTGDGRKVLVVMRRRLGVALVEHAVAARLVVVVVRRLGVFADVLHTLGGTLPLVRASRRRLSLATRGSLGLDGAGRRARGGGSVGGTGGAVASGGLGRRLGRGGVRGVRGAGVRAGRRASALGALLVTEDLLDL